MHRIQCYDANQTWGIVKGFTQTSQSKSAGVMAAADLHFVQHLPSNICSNSGQWSGGHMTSRHSVLSALLFMPTPPDMPLAHDLSSGTLTSSAQQRGQQVPESSGLTYLKGGLQSTAAQFMPEQGGHMTSRHLILSALAFIPMPPDKPLAHERSS